MHSNIAVIGVPYDRNSKGLQTGAAYIFERHATDCRVDNNRPVEWYQVKKIVPKKTREHSTAGFSVDTYDNMVAVGVPDLGGQTASGGAVYVYSRVDKFIWTPLGVAKPMPIVSSDNRGLIASKFGAQVTLRN